MRFPLLLRRGILPGALTVLAACSRDVISPATPAGSIAAPRAATSTDGQPRFISNAVKYRDAGAKPATGRSGSSTLAARALLGKDGVTQLEVTTGSFDVDSIAARPLKHVQVKQLDGSGNTLRTLNYTGLTGGTASLAFNGLARGQALQVQGNVVEPRRTAVVTVTETVHLRPDLRVQLNAPTNVAVGMPVNFAAVVSEANGDVGARADCVLYVNGVEADRAHGIWVDAGDAVSCLLTHTFTTVGAANVRVEAAGVNPADFDPSNNAAEATVQVSGGNSDFDYYAQAEDYVEDAIFADSSYLVFDSGQLSNQVTQTHQTMRFQASMFNGWMRRRITLDSTSIHVSQSTNGATVHSATWPAPAAGHEYPPLSGYPECMSRYGDGMLFYICSGGGDEYPLTNFQYLRDGVAIAYHGIGHGATWWPDAPENVWTNTYEWDGGYGYDAPQITIGPDYSFVVEVTDRGRTYRTSATVQLNTVDTSWWTYYPPDGTLCTSERVDNPDSGFQWDQCRYHRADVTRRWGWTGYYTQENSGF